MILLLTVCFGSIFEKQSRKSNISEFCSAYVKRNHFNLCKYIPKNKRHVLEDWLDKNLDKLSHQPGTNLQNTVIELFSKRPAVIPYVAVFLEYAILNYTNVENLQIDEYIQHVSVMIYNNSEFTPRRRYSDWLCKALFFIGIL